MSEAFSDDFGFLHRMPRVRVQSEPRLIWDNPAPPSADELARLGKVIRTSLWVALVCARVSIAIICQRIIGWCDRHILKSLRSAWAIAAVGWGMTALIPFLFFLMR